MTEKEKMLSGKYYNHYDDELTKDRAIAADCLEQYNRLTEPTKMHEMLKLILGNTGDGAEIKKPFMYDYGYNIILGKNVFVNYNCTMLDCNQIFIGDNTLIAPNVQFYTATHPVDYKLRLEHLENALPIKVGKNVWIGGGAIILPGVTIGDNSTIGAGSVVTKDIPKNCVAAGNPCQVIKFLEKEKGE